MTDPELEASPDPVAGVLSRREVRVFISSTFQDLQAEREELVKRVFPRLRQRLEKRGVALVDVDLRWGITDAEVAEGKLLAICLDEIDACRPFFVGILGDRYGWVPPAFPEALTTEHPWLGEHAGASVTELEFLHGALRDPEAAPRARFYLRARPVAEGAGAAAPGSSEAAETARRQTALDRLALVSLVGQVRASGLALREGFRSPEELGRWVEEDLGAAVDELFPGAMVPSPSGRETLEHEAIVRRLARRQVGIERLVARLEELVEEGRGPVLVSGEPGSGKSSLLAAWVTAARVQHPEAKVVVHVTTATPEAGDLRGLLDRLRGELGDLEEPPAPPAGGIGGLRQGLSEALERAARSGRVVVVLDGLDVLDERDEAPDLAWLPTHLPAGVALVLSACRGSRPAVAAAARGWSCLEMEPFGADQRRDLIVAHLARHHKRLPPSLVERLGASPGAGNPLFLATVCDELRVLGQHERLAEHLAICAGAGDLEALTDIILARVEEDMGPARRPLLVSVLTLLLAARRGLTESELLEVLEAAGGSVPRAELASLLLAVGPLLESLLGRLVPSHGHVRAAVRRRYGITADAAAATHVLLAAYFLDQPHGPRRMDELPHHLAAGGLWSQLAAYLRDPEVLAAHLERSRVELSGLWALAEGRVDLDSGVVEGVEAAMGIMPDAAARFTFVGRVASFLQLIGHLPAAERLQRQAVAVAEATWSPAHANTVVALNNLASTLHARGALAEAEPLYRRILDAARMGGGGESVVAAAVLNNLGEIRRMRGDFTEAERLLGRALEIRKRLLGAQHPETAQSLHNLGLVMFQRGSPFGAEEKLRQALAICETGPWPDPQLAAAAHDSLGYVRHAIRDFAGARSHFQRALDLRLRLLGPQHADTLQAAYNLLNIEVYYFMQTRDRAAIGRLFDTVFAWLLQAPPDSLEARRREIREKTLEVFQALTAMQ